MSRWQKAGESASGYWTNIWGHGLVAMTCVTLTMLFVGVIFIADALLRVPYSVFLSVKEST